MHLACIYTGNSYQHAPRTARPFKVRGVRQTAKRTTTVEIQLDRANVVKLMADLSEWLTEDRRA